MKISVNIVILSDLSDIQTGILNLAAIMVKVNFIKYLLIKYRDTNTEIDPTEEFTQFTIKYPKLSE